MTRFTTLMTAGAVALLVTLAGCGDDDAGSAGPPPETTTSQSTTEPAATTAGEVETAATRVVLSRSGGLAGEQTSVIFAAGEPPPPGFTGTQQQQVLELASDPQLRDLPVSPVPKDLCCDRYLYEVSITWADGTSRSYETADGVEQPALLRALIQATR